MFNSVWYWLNAISCMCTLAKRSLALANWACTSCLSSVKPAHELQPSQTPRLKQQPEEQTKKIQQTLQVKIGQFLENSVIKLPFGIMSRDVTVIHPNRCTAHITKCKYNMLQVIQVVQFSNKSCKCWCCSGISDFKLPSLGSYVRIWVSKHAVKWPWNYGIFLVVPGIEMPDSTQTVHLVQQSRCKSMFLSFSPVVRCNFRCLGFFLLL